MLVLALDTTTRAGSVALARDGRPVDASAGDAARTHATRLPGDILDLLGRNHLALAEVDLFAVAAGPGSFTGLRIGIATIQGLAFAAGKPVVGVSALEALAHSTEWQRTSAPAPPTGETPSTGETPVLPRAEFVAAWMDAQRGEVYAELYDARTLAVVDAARVAAPDVVLDAWANVTGEVEFIGDGAVAYRQVIETRRPGAHVHHTVPTLAPAIARLAFRDAGGGLAGPPHAIRPIYVRRPDAELARDRKRAAEEAQQTTNAAQTRTRQDG